MPAGAAVAEQHAVGVVEVGLVERHTVRMQVQVRVALTDGAVESDDALPFLRVVVAGIPPLALGLVRALAAR